MYHQKKNQICHYYTQKGTKKDQDMKPRQHLRPGWCLQSQSLLLVTGFNCDSKAVALKRPAQL